MDKKITKAVSPVAGTGTSSAGDKSPLKRDVIPEVRDKFRAFLQTPPFGHPALARQVAAMQALSTEAAAIAG